MRRLASNPASSHFHRALHTIFIPCVGLHAASCTLNQALLQQLKSDYPASELDSSMSEVRVRVRIRIADTIRVRFRVRFRVRI